MSADWNNPTTSSNYSSGVLQVLKDRDFDAISLCLADPSNMIDGMLKLVRSPKIKFQERASGAWSDRILDIEGGGTGAASAGGARTALGLGTMAVQDSSAVNISGGTLVGNGAGITALAAANITSGGTLPSLDGTNLLNIVPRGAILPYAGSAAPTNYLICDGSAVSRATYAALFAIIGTTYGVGDGATTFNLPDLRGRAPIGVGTGSGLSARTLAQTLGTETHQLTTPEIPSHAHDLDGTHTHKVFSHNGVVGGDRVLTTGTGVTGEWLDGFTQAPESGATLSAGGDGAHNNMQPVLVLNFIIRY